MADLKDILARLNSGAGNSEPPRHPPSSEYHQPSVSSPVYSPSPSGPNPHHHSAILSPNTSALNTPSNEASANLLQRSAPDLLGILKGRQTSQSSSLANSLPLRDVQTSTENRLGPAAVSAADLVASFTRKPSSLGAVHSASVVAPSASHPELRGEASSSSTNPQDFLLKLLNQGKPDQSRATDKFSSPTITPDIPTLHSGESVGKTVAIEHFSLTGNLPSTAEIVGGQLVAQPLPTQAEVPLNPIEAQSPAHVFGTSTVNPSTFAPAPPKGNVFTYVNPFDQLGAFATPKATSRSATPKIDALKHAREVSKDAPSPAPAGKVPKLSSSATPLASQTTKGIVPEAAGDAREKVEQQVEQSLAQLEITQKEEHLAKPESKSSKKTVIVKTAKEHQATEDMADSEHSRPDSSVDNNWEEAADQETPQKESIKTYQLPMRPFIVIDVGKLEAAEIPENRVTNVARMRKDFDQVDRNLVACSHNYITYPLKNGGLRLIRQDSGKFRQAYTEQEEAIFNISYCMSRKGQQGVRESEAIVCTGVKGTVVWAPLANFGAAGDTTITPLNNEERGFVFHPVPSSDEGTSHGQLKTRAKASSKSPEFFGYGRGKQINLIYTLRARSGAYTNPVTKICDSAQYLKDDNFRINIGRAAKDFAFSADDTVIASLDKAGKLKFWDIRDLSTPENMSEFRKGSLERTVDTPIMSFNTTAPSEKSWPTSVMFVDKDKPMNKGLALRYVIVGRKQNHTVQIWDLAVGKAIQEINFPHEDESAPICSLAFNAKTGVLAVGHPTRNSIYLVHVSPPRYNLQPMSQAKFLNLLVSKDKSIPAPTSTIIGSSIREYTLGDRGTLRSLDIMYEPPMPATVEEAGTTTYKPLFTVIAMHSHGIFEFSMKREHLGWSEDGKATSNPVEAVEAGAATVSELVQPPQGEQSVNGDTGSTVSRKEASTPPKAAETPVKIKQEPKSISAGSAKDKKKKKSEEAVTSSSAAKTISSIPQEHREPSPAPSPGPVRGGSQRSSGLVPAALIAPGMGLSDDDLKRVEVLLSAEFSRILTEQFNILYKRMAEDKRSADKVNAADRDHLLKLISKVLNENTEKSLQKIISDGLSKTVEPLKEVVSNTVDRSITTAFATSIKGTIPREMEKIVPNALSRLLQDQTFVRAVSSEVTSQIPKVLSSSLSDVASGLQHVTLNALSKLSADMETRHSEELRALHNQRKQDGQALSELREQVSGLSGQVTTLTNALQATLEQMIKFQNDINSRLAPQSQSQPATERHTHLRAQSGNSVGEGTPQRDLVLHQGAELDEDDEIRQLLKDGKYDQATLKWLQSSRQEEAFNNIFVHLNPSYVEELDSLVRLSVVAAVTVGLGTNTDERLAYLETVLSTLMPTDPKVSEMVPRIMDVVQQRLQAEYESVTSFWPNSPNASRIVQIAHRVNELKHAAIQGHNG